MSDETTGRPEATEEQKEAVKAATDETREMSDEEIRARIVRLAFGGDRARFEAFVRAIRDAIPPDVTVVLRGSAVVGLKWKDASPFDARGPGTSDIDLTLVGGDMLKLWRDDAFYIPKLHTMPLNDEAEDIAPALVPLRDVLCRLAGRPVNFQATANLVQYARDVLFDQPYFTLLDADDRKAEREAWERELEERANEKRERRNEMSSDEMTK